MIKLRCQSCGDIQEGTKQDLEDSECSCGGEFAILNSEDDEYEEEETSQCPICKREAKDNDDTFECDECDEENLCEDCIISFENASVNICKKCIERIHPSKVETKIEYKDRIIEKEKIVYVDKEGTPVDTSFNPNNKSKFD